MKGRAKLILKSLKQYSTLLFIHLMLDILQELKHLSLLFQKDGLTLQMVSDGLQTTCMVFVAMQVRNYVPLFYILHIKFRQKTHSPLHTHKCFYIAYTVTAQSESCMIYLWFW